VTLLPRIPGYQLEAFLGAGGMGVVYVASRADKPFKYAIKMLLAGRNASTEDLARFRIEAEAYACLNHRCIIKIRDVGVVSGCPYIAMDYADNGSLDKFIKQTPTLDVEWRLQTIRHVAEALSGCSPLAKLHARSRSASGPVMSVVRAVGSSLSTVFLARSKGEAKPNATEKTAGPVSKGE
jgi:serine/threonine protein kinase